MLSQYDQLEAFLNSPCRVIFAGRDVFTGHQTPTERVTTHRYIRILRGSLSYTIDGANAVLNAGSIFLAPKYGRRYWRVPEGQICEILWIEFDSPEFSPDPHTLYAASDRRSMLEKLALLRILARWRFPQYLRSGTQSDPNMPQGIRLEIEGEIKASLARFWQNADPLRPLDDPREAVPGQVHPEIRRALIWLEENFHSSHALTDFRTKLAMSPNHFRKLFHRYTGHSISFHVNKLRMREAMRLLKTSSLSVKEISAAVGFNDPLYFSRKFHQHWDIPPSNLRK